MKRTFKLLLVTLSIIPAVGLYGFSYRLYTDSAPTLELSDSERFTALVASVPDRTGIPLEVVHCQLELESGSRTGESLLAAKRYEHHHLRYAQQITDHLDQQKEYASSHCGFQIMGWHMKLDLDGKPLDRGPWYSLYQPEVCVAQYERIMGSCMSKSSSESRYQQIRTAGICYNGSKGYGEQLVDCVARKAVERL